MYDGRCRSRLRLPPMETGAPNSSRPPLGSLSRCAVPQLILENLNQLFARFRGAMQLRFEMDPAMLEVSSRELLAQT